MPPRVKYNLFVDWIFLATLLVVIVTGFVIWTWPRPAGGRPGAPSAVPAQSEARREAREETDEERVARALGQKVDVHGGEDADLTLADWIDEVKSTLREDGLDVNFVFDAPRVEEAAAPPSSLNIQEDLTDIALENALKIVLRPHDLDFVVLNGSLYITTRDEIKNNPDEYSNPTAAKAERPKKEETGVGVNQVPPRSTRILLGMNKRGWNQIHSWVSMAMIVAFVLHLVAHFKLMVRCPKKTKSEAGA
ncbi:MAG: DUF4405 domain-containing protein [Thermoguttaceae bacterium]|nr:DUF4405 domain-containing protein [Thermoguttaceae bacterium]